MTERTLPGGGVIDDRRTPEEIEQTAGFLVATDSFMSGWGKAQGRSLFAIPLTSEEINDGMTYNRIEERMERRPEFKRVRFVLRDYRPRLSEGDHLSIRGMRDTSSFRN